VQAKPVCKTVGGVTFEDRFAHLQDDTPEALAWQWERDAMARAAAEASPNYIPVRDRLRELSDLPQGQAATHTKPPVRRGSLWFEFAKEGRHEELRVSETPTGPGRTIMSSRDIAKALGDENANVELFWLEASALGRFVAVGWLVNGEQRGKISVYETATNRRIVETDAILYTEARPCWLPDESGFWMADRSLDGLHRLRFVPAAAGAAVRPEVVLPEHLVEATHAGLTPRISPDGRRAVAVAEPHEHVAVVHLDLATLEATRFVPDGWNGDCDGSWMDNETFVARVNSGAPRGRVVAIPASTSRDTSTWREVVPEGEGYVSWAAVIGGRLYVGDFVDLSVRVRVFDLDGKLIETLPLETPGSLPSLNYERAIRPLSDVFGFTHETFTSSESFWLHDPRTGELRQIRAPKHRLNDSIAEQRFATSRDGTQVPYFMVHHSDLDRSRPQPVLVFAYGGFNTSFLPVFPAIFVPFIEAGGIFVQASLRGGGEYGKAWHDAGRLKNKWNTFYDLQAVAEALISDGVSSADRMAFHGLSNGGLTAGAAIVFQPHLWRAVTPTVAVFDVMEMLPVTPETAWMRAIIAEDWGDPTVPEDARSIIEWSPYHNVKDGVEYPAVYQVFGAEDGGCRPFQARKFTARLEEANAGDRPIHMRVWKDTGHAPAADAAAYTAEWLAFVMDQVGLVAKGARG
jgi:prolyl oligopeptidase